MRSGWLSAAICPKKVRNVGKNGFDHALDPGGAWDASRREIAGKESPDDAIKKKRIKRRVVFRGKVRVNRVEARLIVLAKAWGGLHARDQKF